MARRNEEAAAIASGLSNRCAIPPKNEITDMNYCIILMDKE